MLLQKLFGRKKTTKSVSPGIPVGRYSDNNKTPLQIGKWSESEDLFNKEKYLESLDAFFEYLADPAEDNVTYNRNKEPEGEFLLFQGSRVIRGIFNEKEIKAEVDLARMPEPHTPVMRRLLEMNFHLYYTRYAMDGDKLLMRFETDLTTANPNKLYYGLRELAIRADKQDDLLVQEFAALLPMGNEHIEEIPLEEKEMKLKFMHQWIDKALSYVETVDQEKFAGGISYMLLALVYRIDYLLVPEGKLMQDIEKISEAYFQKDNKTNIEKNHQIMDGLKKIREKEPSEIFPDLYRSRHTFSIVSPQNHKTVSDTLQNALQTMYWYRDNNHPFMAQEIMEYGLTYSQYSYSLPCALLQYFNIYMRVNHNDYFSAMGFLPPMFDPATNRLDEDAISNAIEDVNREWKAKYTQLRFDPKSLNFSSLLKFNQSFLNAISSLNFDS